MPPRNVSLTPEQDAFIADVLEKGEYRKASEAMRDAIRALQQRRTIDALKIERLRQRIDLGLADSPGATTKKSMTPSLWLGSMDSLIPRAPEPRARRSTLWWCSRSLCAARMRRSRRGNLTAR